MNPRGVDDVDEPGAYAVLPRTAAHNLKVRM